MKNDEESASNSDPLHGLKHFSAKELQEMDLRPPAYIVEGIVPEGLSLLAAKPKLGKTLFAQNISLALATGENAFDSFPVQQGRVLFLALEGSTAGIQKRLNLMLEGREAPEDLVLLREFPRLDEGGDKTLLRYIHEYPDTALIVVDTLVNVRSQKSSRRGVYELDYEALRPLADLYQKTGVSLLVIHHANKRKGYSDEFESFDIQDTVSGSTGLTGAVDNVLIMEEIHGGVTLHVIPREVERAQHSFELDPDRAIWVPKMNTRNRAKTPERQEIGDLLRSTGIPLKPSEIASKLEKSAESIRVILRQMLKAGDVIQPNYGYYTLPDPISHI